jgi:hypothetical protein
MLSFFYYGAHCYAEVFYWVHFAQRIMHISGFMFFWSGSGPSSIWDPSSAGTVSVPLGGRCKYRVNNFQICVSYPKESHTSSRTFSSFSRIPELSADLLYWLLLFWNVVDKSRNWRVRKFWCSLRVGSFEVLNTSDVFKLYFTRWLQVYDNKATAIRILIVCAEVNKNSWEGKYNSWPFLQVVWLFISNP